MLVIFYFVLGLTISECSKLNQNLECQTRCEDDDGNPKSEYVSSTVYDEDDKYWTFDTTAPEPESINLSHFLFKSSEASTKLGLNITWRQKAYAVQRYVRGYNIDLSRLDPLSGTQVTSFMVPNNTNDCFEYIRIKCMYKGIQGLDICPKQKYQVYVMAAPTSLVENKLKQLAKSVTIPDFAVYNKTTCEIFPKKNPPTTAPGFSTDNNATVIQLSVTAAVLAILIIIAIIIGLKFRRPIRPDLQNQKENLLIIAYDLTKEVSSIATALSQKFGQTLVKYNGWEQNKIANEGLGKWMAESIQRARIIVYVCPIDNDIPQEFTKIHNIFMNIKTGRDEILVLHLRDECQCENCIAHILKRRAFRFKKDWSKLCKAINRQMNSSEMRSVNTEGRALLPTEEITKV